jgi:hypothetical protein
LVVAGVQVPIAMDKATPLTALASTTSVIKSMIRGLRNVHEIA